MKKTIFVLLIFSINSFLFAQGIITTEGPVEPSGGSYELQQSSVGITAGPSYIGVTPLTVGTFLTSTLNFDGNGTENGTYNIPPDPSGAAGTDRVVAVVNCMIEIQLKNGTLVGRDALKDFFAPLTPATNTFDPKVIWDHYENRFVVVTLEKVNAGSNPNAGNTSWIMLAVSKTASPTLATADWWYYKIDAKETRSTYDHWADYPGFAVDEEAIYVTCSMFAHTGGTTDYTNRLWIIDKGTVGGFYTGGATSYTTHLAYDEAGAAHSATTTMPALVYGAGGATTVGGAATGTFLVSYSGLSDGTNEYIGVLRVDDPLGTPVFTYGQRNIGDIGNGWVSNPDAPQLGSVIPIEVNDKRALDAVWRDDPNHSPMLWLVTTVLPNAGNELGETTAYWVRLNTSSWPPTLDDSGPIGGDDILGPGDQDVYTFMPSLAVDPDGNAYFGFSASSAAMYCGAYAAAQHYTDPAGTVQSTETIAAGTDYYVRTFGDWLTDRNRWGDYSGTALDPVTNDVWIFNQFADTRGTATAGPNGNEDGRWSTVWGTGDFPLPVELGEFTADVTLAGVTLNWTTESETENIGFIIERRQEGNDWTELASYKTDLNLGGQGTTSSFTDYEYLDQLVEFGNTYDYRLADVDYNGIVNYNAVRTANVDQPQIRDEGIPLILMNAYPNPFNPITSIQYSISENKKVLVEIYDIKGQLVDTLVNREQIAGWHNVEWNGTNKMGKSVPAGMYFGKIKAGNDIKSTKLMLLK